MQIVIEIPEEKVERLIKQMKLDRNFKACKIVELPKGHGRLIDADEIQFENSEFDTYSDYCIAFDAIDEAESIIEADKTESENNNG